METIQVNHIPCECVKIVDNIIRVKFSCRKCRGTGVIHELMIMSEPPKKGKGVCQ